MEESFKPLTKMDSIITAEDWTSVYKTITNRKAQIDFKHFIEQENKFQEILSYAPKQCNQDERNSISTFVMKCIINLCTGFEEAALFVLEKINGEAFPQWKEFVDLLCSSIDGNYHGFHFVVNVFRCQQSVKMNEGNGSKYLIGKSLLKYFGNELKEVHERIKKEDESKEKKVDEELDKLRLLSLKVDEWAYLMMVGLLDGSFGIESGVKFTLGLIMNDQKFLYQDDEKGSKESKIDDEITEKVNLDTIYLAPLGLESRLFLQYLGMWLQKTVEDKVYYSTVVEIEAKSIENDEFYRDTKNPHLSGIKIRLSDLNYIINLYISSVDHFVNKLEISTESTEHVHLIHLLINILVPVSFLGGYNRQIQALLFPGTLHSTSLLIHHLKTQYYTGKVVVNKDALFGINTNIMRLASNIVHVNKEARDYLMDNQMIERYLYFTRPDDANPLSREASIVFLRYMAEADPKIAEYIHNKNVYDLKDENNKFYSKMDFM